MPEYCPNIAPLWSLWDTCTLASDTFLEGWGHIPPPPAPSHTVIIIMPMTVIMLFCRCSFAQGELRPDAYAVSSTLHEQDYIHGETTCPACGAYFFPDNQVSDPFPELICPEQWSLHDHYQLPSIQRNGEEADSSWPLYFFIQWAIISIFFIVSEESSDLIYRYILPDHKENKLLVRKQPWNRLF